MAATSSPTHRLHIERYRSECIVATAHPNRLRLKNELEASISDRLPGTLATALAPFFRSADDGVVFIRRLDVPLTVSSAWSRERCARRFAAVLSRSLAQTVQAGGDDVIRFPDRAAYLAQFLQDLAAGRAWGAWYYQEFDGLRSLSTSAALRTAVCDEPSTGLAALLKLSGRSADRVLAALTAGDAARILDRLPQETQGGEVEFGRLWMTWNEIGLGVSSEEAVPRVALRLVLETCRRYPGGAGGDLGAMAQALVRLAHRISELPADERLRSVFAWVGLPDAVSTADAAWLAPLRGVHPQRLRAAARALADGQPAPALPGTGAPHTTPFGGAFLLLPLIDRLPITEATHDWPDLGRTAAADFTRFVILMKCMGRPRAPQLFRDGLIRDLMKVDPSIRWEDARSWLAHRSRTQLDRLQVTLAAWQLRELAMEGGDVRVAPARLSGAPAVVLQDDDHRLLLYATGYSPRRPQPLVERLRAWRMQAGLNPEHVTAVPALFDVARSAFPDAALAAQPLESPEPATKDLRELTLTNTLRGARAADLALAVAAQQVLRAFARRFPGFAGSSQPYLFANLLDVSATLQEEPDRRLVRIGRPPLQFVLGRSGMARGSFRLSWLDASRFVLFQEGT